MFARGTNLDDCCREAARLGIKGFDLIGPADWPTLKKYGLVPSMYPGGPGGTIPVALNRKENHERLMGLMNAAIDEAAANAVPASPLAADPVSGHPVPWHPTAWHPVTGLAAAFIAKVSRMKSPVCTSPGSLNDGIG